MASQYAVFYATSQGPIRRTKGIHTEDFEFLKALVPPEVCVLIRYSTGHGADIQVGRSKHQDDHLWPDMDASTPWVR